MYLACCKPLVRTLYQLNVSEKIYFNAINIFAKKIKVLTTQSRDDFCLSYNL